MKFLVVFAVLIAGSLAQNPYEYVDDALIQRVGQIIYEYDQGQGSRSNSNKNSFQEAAPAVQPVRSMNTGYQAQMPQRAARVSNFDYKKPQQQQQQQPMYQQTRTQRQFNNVQQQPSYQPQQPQRQMYHQNREQRQYASPPMTREHKEPQVPQQKSFGYSLSQPEVVPMVAEWHETFGGENSQDSFRGMGNNNNDYRQRY